MRPGKTKPGESGAFIDDLNHVESYYEVLAELPKRKFKKSGALKQRVEISIIRQNGGIEYFLDANNVMQNRKTDYVKAIFELANPTTGEYKLVTMYPTTKL